MCIINNKKSLYDFLYKSLTLARKSDYKVREMEQVIYIDSVFIINTYCTYMIISLLRVYPGVNIRVPQKAALAVLGTALSLPALCFFANDNKIQALINAFLSLAVVSAICAKGGLRQFYVVFRMLFVYTLMLGGGILFISRSQNLLSLLVCSLTVYMIIKKCMRMTKHSMSLKRNIYSVHINSGDISINTKGLMDTGNRLYDPVYGRPVIILSKKYMKEFLNYKERFCCIPYRTVGLEDAMMYGIRVDSVMISQGSKTELADNIICAFSEYALTDETEYDTLLHPDILNGGN